MKRLQKLGFVFVCVIIGYYVLKIVFSFFGFLIGILNVVIFSALIGWVIYRIVNNKGDK